MAKWLETFDFFSENYIARRIEFLENNMKCSYASKSVFIVVTV